jgi:hypothetical protein
LWEEQEEGQKEKEKERLLLVVEGQSKGKEVSRQEGWATVKHTKSRLRSRQSTALKINHFS